MCARTEPAPGAAQLASQAYLGRLLSYVENDPLGCSTLLAQLPAPPRPPWRIGITGSPGVGKSTLIARLIVQYRSAGLRPGIIAVDPSSPFSGGALLGDRLRWVELAGPDVFVRSLASRGSLGGVSAGAGAAAAVLESAGYCPLLIETVGMGQTGFDVLGLVDTALVLFSPESGDGLQMLKAGLLEAGDVFAVNKADRPGAEALLSEIRHGLSMNRESLAEADRIDAGVATDAAAASPSGWPPPVLPIAAATSEGVDALVTELARHRDWLAALPASHPRRLRRIVGELAYTLRSHLSTVLGRQLQPALQESARRVQSGDSSLWESAQLLLNELRRCI
jgi:LAO/AO transport system kinase